MAKIKKIVAHEILDSRGYPTIETIIQLDDSSVGVFSVPSGSSIGKHEAMELRDKDPKRYEGRGVLKNLQKKEKICEKNATSHLIAYIDERIAGPFHRELNNDLLPFRILHRKVINLPEAPVAVVVVQFSIELLGTGKISK